MTFYRGFIECNVFEDHGYDSLELAIFFAACRELKRSFPYRNHQCWKMIDYEEF